MVPTIPLSAALREYDHALATLKHAAVQCGKSSTQDHVAAAKCAAAALTQAFAAVRQAERAEGTRIALNALTELIADEGGPRARSVPMFRVDQLMRSLFTKAR